MTTYRLFIKYNIINSHRVLQVRIISIHVYTYTSRVCTYELKYNGNMCLKIYLKIIIVVVIVVGSIISLNSVRKQVDNGA